MICELRQTLKKIIASHAFRFKRRKLSSSEKCTIFQLKEFSLDSKLFFFVELTEIMNKVISETQLSSNIDVKKELEMEENCTTIFMEAERERNLQEKTLIRSYQKELLEYYQKKVLTESSNDFAKMNTSFVHSNCERKSRQNKRDGWSISDPEKQKNSRYTIAVKTFFVNLTRPTDQRNQPLPKKIKFNKHLIPHHQPQPKQGGKMKVGLKMKGEGGRACCRSGYCTRCFSQVDASRRTK